MRRTRVIPVLLIHRGGVYKTQKFKKPKYIGDPINTIRLFNDLEVDEIIVLDIDSSKDCAAPNLEMIQELANEAFMPFSYGGGIQAVEQAREILQCGIEKIILNHSVQEDRSLIRDCAMVFGSQSVVAAVDYKKRVYGGYQCFDHVNKRCLNNSVVTAAVSLEKEGAGELFINSVDKDGMMSGLDIKVIEQVSRSVNVPLIACGGASTLEHLREAENAGASAIAAGSMFVYYGKQHGVLINYPSESILREFLK